MCLSNVLLRVGQASLAIVIIVLINICVVSLQLPEWLQPIGMLAWLSSVLSSAAWQAGAFLSRMIGGVAQRLTEAVQLLSPAIRQTLSDAGTFIWTPIGIIRDFGKGLGTVADLRFAGSKAGDDYIISPAGILWTVVILLVMVGIYYGYIYRLPLYQSWLMQTILAGLQYEYQRFLQFKQRVTDAYNALPPFTVAESDGDASDGEDADGDDAGTQSADYPLMTPAQRAAARVPLRPGALPLPGAQIQLQQPVNSGRSKR